MNNFIIYCTEEQTKKALELGAPIKYKEVTDFEGHVLDYNITETPTAEQMRGWLEKEMGITVEVSRQYGINKYCYYVFDNYGNDIESIESKTKFNSRKDAMLVGIDVALEYLTNNKK